jgi:D-alanyl-D-alanine-carboxypeptidase/D-alanyl-D-alanine-endopeptidase
MRMLLGAVAVVLPLTFISAQPSREAELLALLKTRVDGGKNVGIVAGTIDTDGKAVIAAYGNAGPEALPLDADSVFEIGSITKVFTAILLADMADRGEVALDDPIANYLPKNMRVPEKNGRKITLLDLSVQVSGLPRMPDNFKPANPQNPYVDYTVEQMYDFLSRHELRRDPGALFEYSNLGVGLLGHVLTLRAGKPYELLVKERILEPLDMDHTAITLTPWMQQHLVKGHNVKGEVVSNWDVGVLAAAGGLRSTLTDMLKFARANLQATDRLTRVMQRTHAERANAGNPAMFIGMNWIIRRSDGQDITWHNGGTAGYRTWMGFDAKRKTAAVVLTNSGHGADDLGFALLK